MTTLEEILKTFANASGPVSWNTGDISVLVAALAAAEARGRAEERAAIVAWFRETYNGTFERIMFERIADDIESGAHTEAEHDDV